jgi:hypothetical protein
MKLTGKNRRTRGKACHRTTLSTTNPTWNDPRSNPGLRGGRPAANRLSHGTAICVCLCVCVCWHDLTVSLCKFKEGRRWRPTYWLTRLQKEVSLRSILVHVLITRNFKAVAGAYRRGMRSCRAPQTPQNPNLKNIQPH